MTIDELLEKWRAGRREIAATLNELNSAENRRIAYEFVQVMAETKEKLGYGYVSQLEFTSKGHIRATVPWWGGSGPALYHFNRRILASEEYRLARIEKIAAKRARRDERRRLEREAADRAQFEKLRAQFEGQPGCCEGPP